MRPFDRRAHPTATMLPPLRQFLAIALTLGAVLFAYAGLQSLILPGPWSKLGVVFLGIVAAGTFVSRLVVSILWRREPHLLASLIPTVLAGALALWLLAARFGGHSSAIELGTSWSDLTQLRDLVLSAKDVAAENIAPINPYEPIVFLAIGGAILVFLLADLLGNAVRVPALVAVTILPLWLPSIIIAPQSSIILPLGSCLCLLGLIALDNPFQASFRNSTGFTVSLATEGRRRFTSRTAGFSSVVGALMIITMGIVGATAVSPHLPWWGHINPPSVLQYNAGMRVSNNLDLSASLQNRSNEVAFTYVWDGPVEDLEPLRTATLTEYNDGVWEPTQGDGRSRPTAPDQTLWPFGATEGDLSGTLTITIDKFQDDTLPIPNEPRTLTSRSTASYNAAQDVIRLDAPTVQGQQYTIEAFSRDLTEDQLRSPGSGALVTLPEGYSTTALKPAFQVPNTPHITDIKKLALKITEDAPTQYDKAVRLQEYFRDPGMFTYSLSLPEPRSEDAIWDFLTDRTGYCVQYSSAMTVMARTLGLPARIGVGFLPGQKSGENEYTVRGQDAHAWTEIFFDNVGWVRFDPTPAVQSGRAPQHEPAPGTGSPTPSPSITPEPTAEPSTLAPTPTSESSLEPSASSSAGADSASVGGRDAARFPWLLWLGASSLVLVVVLVGSHHLRRRARLNHGLENAWNRVVGQGVKLGVLIEPAATVRQIADLLEPDIAWGAACSGPVHELALLIEEERYSERSSTTVLEQAHLDDIVERASRELISRFTGPHHVAVPNAPQGDA